MLAPEKQIVEVYHHHTKHRKSPETSEEDDRPNQTQIM